MGYANIGDPPMAGGAPHNQLESKKSEMIKQKKKVAFRRELENFVIHPLAMKPYSWLNKEHWSHLTPLLPSIWISQFHKETHLPHTINLGLTTSI